MHERREAHSPVKFEAVTDGGPEGNAKYVVPIHAGVPEAAREHDVEGEVGRGARNLARRVSAEHQARGGAAVGISQPGIEPQLPARRHTLAPLEQQRGAGPSGVGGGKIVFPFHQRRLLEGRIRIRLRQCHGRRKQDDGEEFVHDWSMSRLHEDSTPDECGWFPVTTVRVHNRASSHLSRRPEQTEDAEAATTSEGVADRTLHHTPSRVVACSASSVSLRSP